MLLAAFERMTLLALPAFDGRADGFGSLGRVLPVLPLGIALRARADDDLLLLMQRFIESGQKGLDNRGRRRR